LGVVGEVGRAVSREEGFLGVGRRRRAWIVLALFVGFR
jgi:hypothetical protein